VIHLHKWGRWQDAEATYTSPLFPKVGTSQRPIQIRACERCGKKKIREIQ
jgi:hypothetical protein